VEDQSLDSDDPAKDLTLLNQLFLHGLRRAHNQIVTKRSAGLLNY
jgi:hypothetical protein